MTRDSFAEMLSARLDPLEALDSNPDWDDVQNRRRRLVVRRRALRGGLSITVAFVAVASAVPAFGLRSQLTRLFTESTPAPPPVVKHFSEMDVGAPPGMAPNVIAGEARAVMDVRLSTGKRWVLWVAPTQHGGFCMQIGCDRDRSLPFAPGLVIPGPISASGEILEPPVVFEGHTLIQGAATVEVRFEDGENASTPVVWVSQPIDAGFFVYELPPSHWTSGHRPVALVLEDADGNELARDTVVARSLGKVIDRAKGED
jgi:hypothetical protein